MTQVYDLSDPAKPVHIRDFGIAGQEPGSSGTPPTELHGGISTGPQGNRVYFGYGTNKGGILQIVDREKLLKGPKEPTPDNLRSPVIGELQMSPLVGAHTVFPLGKMRIPEFAERQVRRRARHRDDRRRVAGERMPAGETRQMVWFVDATIEKHPMVVSNFTVPEASGNFCERGGRFGAHSSNESMAPVFYKKIAVRDVLQCRRARDRHPQSVPAEGSRLLHPVDHRGDRQALHQGRRQGPLQDRDPEQQCGDRRPRLHLRGRPREYRAAHSGADRGGEEGGGDDRDAAVPHAMRHEALASQMRDRRLLP